MTAAEGAGRPGRRPGELTVDELAARVGMTVRNVRAYAGRGLLPPPRLVGRTGYYGPEHVARLTLVRSMLAEGYTLQAVERAVAEAPPEALAGLLELNRALVTPYAEEEPEEIALADLLEEVGGSGAALDPAALPDLLRSLTEAGVLEVLEGGRVRLLEPTLLRAGLQVVRLGVPVEEAVAVQQQAAEHARAVADLYVGLFVRTVWRGFVEQGMPAGGWQEVAQAVERAQPVAAQALLASFRRALGEAISDAALDEASLVGQEEARRQA